MFNRSNDPDMPQVSSRDKFRSWRHASYGNVTKGRLMWNRIGFAALGLSAGAGTLVAFGDATVSTFTNSGSNNISAVQTESPDRPISDALTGIGSFDLSVGSVTQTTVTVSSAATKATCPTAEESTDLNGRTVSKAVNDLNRSLLAEGVNPGTTFDPLWANHFKADNGGMPAGAPTANTVVLRQLVSIENCEIR